MIDLIRPFHDIMEAEVFVCTDPGIQWTEAGMCVDTNTVLVIFRYDHAVLGEVDVRALKSSCCTSAVESLLVRGLGHQSHPCLLSYALLMMQLSLPVLGRTSLRPPWK